MQFLSLQPLHAGFGNDEAFIGQHCDSHPGGKPFQRLGARFIGCEPDFGELHVSSRLAHPGSLSNASTAVNSSPSDIAQKEDRKSTRLNSSHTVSSYAVLCL